MRKALLYLLNIPNRFRMIFGNRAGDLKDAHAIGAARMDNEIDDAVIRAFSLGSESAFKQIYDHYAPAIYRVACRYFQSSALAEALVRELFSELWLERESYTRAAQLKLDLFTGARNLAIKYLEQMTAEVLSGRRADRIKQGQSIAEIS